MTSTERPLLIRADASAEIGTGHVMRCLALAQAWQAAGGAAVFAQHVCPDALAVRLRDEGMATEAVIAAPASPADAAETVALARQLGAEWVVVDGYAFGAEYQEALRETGLRLLFVDDYSHAERYAADFVLNQNAYADEALYPKRAPQTRLLLGLRYLLLRREFWSWEGHLRAVPEHGRRILVALGGGDPQNITRLVVDALGQIDDPHLEAVVLIGAGSPHATAVRRQAEADRRIEVRHNATDMPTLLAWADVGITGGGSICYEAALLGLPSLVIILAENQRPVARALVAAGAVELLGDYNVFSVESAADEVRTFLADCGRRVEMCTIGQRLVSGGGAQRVVQEIRGLSAEPTASTDSLSPVSA